MVAPPAGRPSQTQTIEPRDRAQLQARPITGVPDVKSATFPLSARREPVKLDLNTVERKGCPSIRDHGPRRNRPYDLPEAPTFRPTEAEFRDPMEYIRAISSRASKYGICKIIPPDSWNPPLAVDTERFHFRTRKQEINQVEGSNRTHLNYLDQLAKYHKQHGAHLNRFPSVDKKPLDLYKLKKAVETRGGFEYVCTNKKWAEIGRDLGYSGKIMSSLSTSLKNSYQRWLQPYEDWLKSAKSHGTVGEVESNGYYPMAVNYPQHIAPQSKPVTAAAIQSTDPIQMSTPSNGHVRPLAPSQPQSISATFQPQSFGGFTPVNCSPPTALPGSGFTSVNRPPPSAINGHIQHSPGLATVNGQDQQNSMMHASPPVSHVQQSNSLKRTASFEDMTGDETSDSPSGDGDMRRSKRPKRESVPTAPIVSMRPSTPVTRRSTVRRNGEHCEICNTSDDRYNIILCDTCDQGYHRYCVEPALRIIPDYEWHCPKCLLGTHDYGFEDGNVYSLRSFQEKANLFKQKYFTEKCKVESVDGKPSEEEIEKEFWRLVEDITDTVEVEYGADIHSTTHGSAFPTVEKNPLDPYSRDAWNLNVLPFHPESLFRHIKGDISGMTVPWLYVGMCFSTFCWHNEDHYAYSANYQHLGATKTWYGIPGSHAEAFEVAVKQIVPELFESQPDLLSQLVTLIPPDQLKKVGVAIYAVDQRAGEFVITWPQAYHAGFNHGFNFNEAVNFAPSDWEPFGDRAILRLQQEYRKDPVFSHEELLFRAAQADTSIVTAKWLGPALQRVERRELEARDQFVQEHDRRADQSHARICTFNTLSEEIPPECNLHILVSNEEAEEEEYQCSVCKAFCYLSQFRCEQTGKVSCLLHAHEPCCENEKWNGPDHLVILRYTNHELRQIVQKVVNKANLPNVWQAKLGALLEGEDAPSLKSLQNLLAEGQKIDFELEGIDDLAEFVDKCSLWTEEANIYVTRKQQNRRKNEKAWRKSSTKNSKANDDKDSEPEMSLERMKTLLVEAEELGFAAPQVDSLREKLDSINEWRDDVKLLFEGKSAKTAEELGVILEAGRGFGITMPELRDLEKLHMRAEWSSEVTLCQNNRDYTLSQCKALFARAEELGIVQDHLQVTYLKDVIGQGELWVAKAKELLAADDVHYPQLEALFNQVSDHKFCVEKDIYDQMDQVLAKNREAKKQIITLVERSRDPDFSKRPNYGVVREVMKSLEDLNGKPYGAADLEKEVKKHEDWMRKGKKLFGKANAPLHILEQHMRTVEERNAFCFDLEDTFRPPVEPASREASPSGGVQHKLFSTFKDEDKPVFCICRQPEAGLMIECETCHDWYHGKCLKLARGRVKEYDMFTCPICDWRVKIPRDAARPKLEELAAWQDEIQDLPFQPEEEELLRRIVDKAQAFRDFLSQYTNGSGQLYRTEDQDMFEMLFYLRKIEGAEVLLAYETNVLRQECHKWQPIAPEPPPIIDASVSTRKPRPTKQQKLMREYNVTRPEDLPQHIKVKTYQRKKTALEYPSGALMPRGTDHSLPHVVRPSSPLDIALNDAPLIRPAAMQHSRVSGFGSDFAPTPQQANRPHFGTPSVSTYRPNGDGNGYPDSPMFSPSTEQPNSTRRRDDMIESSLRQNGDHGHRHDQHASSMFDEADREDNDVAEEQDPHEQAQYVGLFREMTNAEDDDGDGVEATPGLQHETSQAQEALDMIGEGEERGTGMEMVGLGVSTNVGHIGGTREWNGKR